MTSTRFKIPSSPTWNSCTHFKLCTSSKSSAPSGPVSSSAISSNAAEQRKEARKLLLQLDRAFLALVDLAVMFDIFGSNSNYVEAYIVLASTGDTDEVRQSWLKRRIVEVNEKLLHP